MWRPVLMGAEAERARAVALQIFSALEPHAADGSLEPGLQLGSAGVAVAFAELARMEFGLDAEKLTSLASAALDLAGTAVAEQDLRAGLQSGLAGIGWAVQFITRDDDTCAELDALLLEHVLGRPRGDAQLFEANLGLVGIGLYGLERMPSAAGRDLVRAVLDRLPDNAVHSEQGTGWLTPAASLGGQAPAGHYNLGLAHGTPGALAFLAAALRAGVGGDAERKLARDGARWLLAQHAGTLRDDGRSPYPDLLLEGVPLWRSGHYGWCYGAPAVAVAVCAVGEALEDGELLAFARAAALEAAAIRPSVPDAILCHGTGGLQLIFQRLWEKLDEPLLADAARHWARATLALQEAPERGIAGFTSARPWERPEAPAFTDPSLAVGAAGTALSLLAAAGDQPPDWDRAFLLSARTAAEL